MPTYRSITISLVSQFDIMSIPEYAPPTAPKHSTPNLPVLINPEHSLVSVYIPTYPSSQFWISYSISPPHPPRALYYFKLFLHGSCVVSWGCSEEDGYRGRTMFAMFDTGEIDKDQALLERRALSFGVETVNATDTKFMEIKVYRSKGRKRIQPQVRGFRETLGPGVKNNIPSGDEEGIQSVDYFDWFCPCTDIPTLLQQPYPGGSGTIRPSPTLLQLRPPGSNQSTVCNVSVLLPKLGYIFPPFFCTPPAFENQTHHFHPSPEQLEALGVFSTPPELAKSVDSHSSIEQPTTSTNNDSASACPNNDTDPPTPPPKPPRKGKPPPHRSAPVLVSSLKSRSRSLPSSPPTRSLFSTLTRRSPSPPKRTFSSPPPRRGRLTGLSSPSRSSNRSSHDRSGSLVMLKSVVNNAMMRRARGVVSADNGDLQREPWTDRSADEVVERRQRSRMDGDDGPENKDMEGGEDESGAEDQRRGKGRKVKEMTSRDRREPANGTGAKQKAGDE